MKHTLECEKLVKAKLDILENIVKDKFGLTLLGVKISYDLKGLKAGLFNPKSDEIKLNGKLCTEFPERMADEVLVHEVAHFVTNKVFKNSKPHGSEWKHIAMLLGLDKPKATHDMPVKPVRQFQRYKYKCRCGIHNITSVRHKRIITKKAKYSCKRCGGLLEKV
ncbi:SprT-like domain-containing protein [Deferribacteraceae bacterium V6Fe1]|nr:SprT-like domain-containing protein [Deferribacteraceae bacterium V6Fe1]